MKHYRCERVADLITREVAKILRLKIADPRLQFVTITDCKVTKDIRVAYVYYSVLGDSVDENVVSEGLEKAKGFIRRELGNSLDMRYIPEVRFQFDHSLAQGNRIWDQLESIHQEDELDIGSR
ncbi:30S ribosome-binding factor RbfA [bacterium]|nr:30S ribosome-binding factor RbfA [bacterium]